MRPLIQLGLVGILVAGPAGALSGQTPAPAPMSEPELLRRLGATLDSLSAEERFSGVVVLTKRGVPVFQRAAGMADRAAGRLNDIETAFNLGSINKLFTATAVRQLAIAGTLHLDSTVAAYWPEYPNPAVAGRVTIRQLLEHRSGIGGNIFGVIPGRRRQDLRHNRDYLPLFVQAPQAFEPGTDQRYSNAGYVVLGMLVERLSGEDYYAYLRRHIFAPAGMIRTDAFAVDSLPGNTALGYTRGGADAPTTAPLRPNTESLPGRGSAAGGGYSSAPDLMRLLAALKRGTIAGAPPSGVGIAGGAPGLNAVIEGELRGEYDLIVLTNLDPPAAERIAELVRAWLGVRDD